jgi:hypothetical protein
MTISSFRAVEPLYIVILRDNKAETILRAWVRDNKIEHTTVTGNRMMLHHQQAFDRLLITWSGPWENITIWDTWNRRHIYF